MQIHGGPAVIGLLLIIIGVGILDIFSKMSIHQIFNINVSDLGLEFNF